jgi:hypothetical protein
MNIVNSQESWLETYAELVTKWNNTSSIVQDNVLERIAYLNGRFGVYEELREWTDEFELIHKDEDWSEKDFFEEIDDFFERKNKLK